MKSEFINCKNCAEDCQCKGKDITPICLSFKPAKISNADRIRAMSDEELADFLDRWEMGDVDYSKTFCDLCDGHYDCHNDCLLDWLRQEVSI